MTRTPEALTLPALGYEQALQTPNEYDIPPDFTELNIESQTYERADASLFDSMKHSRSARLLAIGVAAFTVGSAAKETISTEKAHAQQPGVEITSLKQTFEFRVAGSKASEETISKATVLGNYRTISKAKLNRSQKQKRCRVIDGKKVNIWTQGRHETGRPYGRDTRRSLFCRYKTSKGWQWYRKACGNAARFKMPENAVRGKVFWVNDYRKAHLSVVAKSEAAARAECRTANTSAFGYGRGEGSAKATLNLRSGIKKLKARISSLKTSGSLKASGEARSKAFASASAQCSESSTESFTTFPQPVSPQPAPQPTPETNQPPQGEMRPPQHLYSQGLGKVCVDNIRDPEGGPVQAFNFRVYRADDPAANDNNPNTVPNGVGTFTSGVYQEPGGAQCRNYQAPYTTQSFRAASSASLSDGHNNVLVAPVQFDILKDDFGQ